jgi:hypothetical protein
MPNTENSEVSVSETVASLMYIPAPDSITPMVQQGRQSRITRDQAYMPNSQVNSFLAVHTYCSWNWMLLNHDDCLLYLEI